MAKKTNYTDPNGVIREGYIENGITYTDKGLTTRVPVGSVVETAGGTYYKGSERPLGVLVESAGGNDDSFSLYGKSYKTYYNDDGVAFADASLTTKVPDGTTLYKDGGRYVSDDTLGVVPTMSAVRTNYDKQFSQTSDLLSASMKAQQEASAVRTDSRLRALRAREAEIKKEKEMADRLSYNAYLQSVNPYGVNAQKTARLGLTSSGFGETSLAKLGNTYQMALSGNESARAAAMRELTALCDTARAEGDREQYEIYANMYNSLISLTRDAAETRAELDKSSALALEEKLAREAAARREEEIRRASEEREDAIRREEYAREDAIRQQEYAREDAIRREEYAREDAKRASTAAKKTTTTTKKSDGINISAVRDVAKKVLSGQIAMKEAADRLGFSEEEMANLIRIFYLTSQD